MQIVLGPILRLRGVDERWRVSVLVVVDGDQAPNLQWTSSSGESGVAPGTRLAGLAGRSVWRHELAPRRTAAAATVEYQLATGPLWRFTVPAADERPRMAYCSCNGFSSQKVARRHDEPFALWKQMAEVHAADPYHLLLMGGDQVYADALWEMEELDDWSNSSLITRLLPISAPLAEKIDRFYFDLYVKRLAQPDTAAVLASVPTAMMWDDHDIFDGWGSHGERLQGSNIYRQIFASARRWFSVFQLHRTLDAPTAEFITPTTGFSYAHRIDDLAIVALDLRSERDGARVMGQDSWNAALRWIDAQAGLAHLLVMTSIPMVFPDLGTLEDLLGHIPGKQELEDDLRDHWSSRGHQGERLRLIHRLLDFGAANHTRVTIVSGDVHVAALGLIESNRGGRGEPSQSIHQLIASGIVHPPAPGIVVYALEKMFDAGGTIDRGIELSMQPMPGSRRRLVAARNWLSIEPDVAWSTSRRRLWANWYVEGETQPYPPKVIHPV